MSSSSVSGAPKTQFHQFSLDYTRLLKDDFVHKKLLTVKYNGKGQDFVTNGKLSVNPKKTDSGFKANSSSEVKFVSRINNTTVEAKTDSKGLIRVWANLGKRTFIQPLNFFAKVKTNSAFDKFSASLHASFKNETLQADGRFELKNGLIPCFNEKLIYNVNDNFKVGYVAKLNLIDTVFMRYDCFMGFKFNNFGFTAEHISQNPESFKPGKFIFASTLKHKDLQGVVRVSYRTQREKEKVRVVAGGLYKVNKDLTVRAKVDSAAKISAAVKYNLNDNVALTAALGGNLKNPKSFALDPSAGLPFGLQVDFNAN